MISLIKFNGAQYGAQNLHILANAFASIFLIALFIVSKI